jgi:putative Ca2+/H+ antiporter (TMEM165/GDT1 family)
MTRLFLFLVLALAAAVVADARTNVVTNVALAPSPVIIAPQHDALLNQRALLAADEDAGGGDANDEAVADAADDDDDDDASTAAAVDDDESDDVDATATNFKKNKKQQKKKKKKQIGAPIEYGLNSPGFVPAFFSSISMIIVSELGDKTFFIAAILAMRHNKWTIFFAAAAALAVMTVLSAAMGFALPNLLSPVYTHHAATMLFLFFGFRLLKDAYDMESTAANLEELKEVEEELETKEFDDDDVVDVEGGAAARKEAAQKRKGGVSCNAFCASPVFIQCFTMTFLAEWGDRSQIATIAMAAAKDPYGVTIGGIIGHAFCTMLAVIGGKLLATRISEKYVAATGGALFLLFAAHSLMSGAPAAI